MGILFSKLRTLLYPGIIFYSFCSRILSHWCRRETNHEQLLQPTWMKKAAVLMLYSILLWLRHFMTCILVYVFLMVNLQSCSEFFFFLLFSHWMFSVCFEQQSIKRSSFSIAIQLHAFVDVSLVSIWAKALKTHMAYHFNAEGASALTTV